MKKIISILLTLLCVFGTVQVSYAKCDVNGDDVRGQSIGQLLDGCLEGSELVNPGDGKIESGIKDKIIFWTSQLSGLLGLLAVGAIVYGGLMMTISGGEDEKIKKGKDIVKWSMLGFLGLIAASGIVRLIVEVMFSVAG